MTFTFSPWNFFLVLGRTSTLLAFFPMFQEAQIPRMVRIWIAFWISLAILPTLPAGGFYPASLWDLAFAVGIEALIGALFALTIRFIFAGISLGTQWIDSEIGFQVAQQLNPISGTPNSPFGTMALIAAGLIFWSLGFFEELLILWAKIFQLLPPPVLGISLKTGDTFITISSQIFLGALQIAAPIVMIMFLVSLATGLLSRALPGVNIFVEGFNLKIIIGIVSLIALTPFLVSLMHHQLQQIPDHWAALLRSLTFREP